MTWSPDSSITGATVTGLTSPTYTLAADLAPDSNSRQYYVSAVGGTQTNVRAHTAGDPFMAVVRRTPYRSRPNANPINGAYPNVPMNKIEILARKGLFIDSNETVRNGNLRLVAELPAGSALNDAVNIKALVSFLIGLLTEESDDYADSLIKGVV